MKVVAGPESAIAHAQKETPGPGPSKQLERPVFTGYLCIGFAAVPGRLLSSGGEV